MCECGHSVKKEIFSSMTKISYAKSLNLFSKSNQGWCRNYIQKSYEGRFHLVGKEARSGVESVNYISVKLSFFLYFVKGTYRISGCKMPDVTRSEEWS